MGEEVARCAPANQIVRLLISSSKCSLVFNHRDHKERREVADLRLICRFFVFSVLFVVECVLHLELLVAHPPIRFTIARMICRSDSLSLSIFLHNSTDSCRSFAVAVGNKPAFRMTSSGAI